MKNCVTSGRIAHNLPAEKSGDLFRGKPIMDFLIATLILIVIIDLVLTARWLLNFLKRNLP